MDNRTETDNSKSSQPPMPKSNQPSQARRTRVLILVGIPGSGKSTFARHLEDRGWKRINQDDLGNRKECEKKATESLEAGYDVVIDRCNFDRKQRKHWVDIARNFGSTVGSVVFYVPIEVCISRVRKRTGHPTLPGDDPHSPGIVRRMASDFVNPSRDEGIDFCRVVENDAQISDALRDLA